MEAQQSEEEVLKAHTKIYIYLYIYLYIYIYVILYYIYTENYIYNWYIILTVKHDLTGSLYAEEWSIKQIKQ